MVDGFPDGDLVSVNIKTQPVGGDGGCSTKSLIPSLKATRLGVNVDTHKITNVKSIDHLISLEWPNHTYYTHTSMELTIEFGFHIPTIKGIFVWLRNIVTRQLALADINSKSWTSRIKKLLTKYDLPPASDLLQSPAPQGMMEQCCEGKGPQHTMN